VIEVRSLKKQIKEIEGFDVDICGPDGKKVRGDYGGAHKHDYKRMAPGYYTISRWISERFERYNPHFIVKVKDGDGNIIEFNNTKLETVRETYRVVG